MGGGAVVAVAAAARRRRTQEVLDAYRVAGATSAEHARAATALGLTGNLREVDDLRSAGVLTESGVSDQLYLDEAAYLRYRDSRRSRTLTMIIVMIVVLAAILITTAVLVPRLQN